METSSRKNVLLFSGATYPAIQIIDCLKNNPRFHIIAAGSYPNHSEFVCDDVITNLPFINDEKFMDVFIKLIHERNIEFIIPTDEDIATLLMKNKDIIPAIIVCSPYETTLLCRHKKLTYEYLVGEEFTPRVYSPDKINEIEYYPVFVKPDNLQGSKGTQVVWDKDELQKIDNLESMVICEHLPGEEYTVDCFTNKNRELLFCNPRVRTRLMNGITARGNNVECSKEFKKVIEKLNSKVHFRGYWFVQLKRDVNGNLKLLEICTRFAGSFGISKALGVNIPLLALCDFSGLDTSVVKNEYKVVCDKIYIDRYRLDINYTQLYVDYDDTVTSNNGNTVNPYVIAYLYQCKARQIKLSLITRHFDTFNETLSDSFSRLHIDSSLFDEIIELKWEDNKADCIKNTDSAIFLDNSFAERKKIKDATGIPVFDVTNIDALFDWRY